MKFWCAGLWGFLAGAGFVGNGFAQAKPVAPATPEAAAEWALSLSENARMQALQGVLNGWAQTDPAAAADWSRRLSERDRWAAVSIVSTWAYQDPGAAAKWVASLPEGQQKTQSFEVLGSAWAAKNHKDALFWAEKIQPEINQQAALGGVLQSWAREDSSSAMQYAEQQKDPKIREFFLGKVVAGWSSRDRNGAENWVKNLSDGELKIAMQKAVSSSPVIRRRILPVPPTAAATPQKKIVLSFPTPHELAKIYDAPVSQARQDALVKYALEWFERDPDKATQWIAAKLKGYVLTKTAGAVARKWSQKDLAGAAEWVRQIPPFWRDFVAALGSEWAGENPQEKAKAVLEWPDNMRRHVILRGVVERWAQKDPTAALAWVQALPAGPTKIVARRGLVVGWMIKDEPGCRKYVESIPDPTEKQTALHYVMHGLARVKPKEALAFMDTLPDRGTGPPTYCLGKEWALVDPLAAAEWAKGLAEGAAKEQALQAILRQWVYVDAVQVANWAASLPEKESRTEALNAVMENWIDQNPQQGLAWAQSQPDSEKKAEGIAAAIRTWGQLEPQEAQKWVTGLKDEKLKKNLLEEAMPVPVANLVAGQEAPDFKASTLDGKPFLLSDYRGKYVLLDFWATWCGPCLAETPNLKKIHEAFGKRDDFVLIGLSLDRDPEKPRAYLKENQCGWVDGFLGDWGKDKVTKKYGVQGIPSIWLIGPDGKIVHKGLRGERIYEAVNSALQAKK